jgi:hypothetical protein
MKCVQRRFKVSLVVWEFRTMARTLRNQVIELRIRKAQFLGNEGFVFGRLITSIQSLLSSLNAVSRLICPARTRLAKCALRLS